METKWTPGPWHVGMRNGSNASMVLAHIGDDIHHDPAIASIYGIPVNRGLDECADAEGIHNAHLIAAAPDLYEALSNIENDDGRIPESIWAMRNAALAKARGEA